MLERLRIKNFKLLRDVELEFQRDVPTVLIGPNASGKSTVIEVLDFLARCATEGLEPALIAGRADDAGARSR
jgi:AAA15 family ATPase/GTPase